MSSMSGFLLQRLLYVQLWRGAGSRWSGSAAQQCWARQKRSALRWASPAWVVWFYSSWSQRKMAEHSEKTRKCIVSTDERVHLIRTERGDMMNRSPGWRGLDSCTRLAAHRKRSPQMPKRRGKDKINSSKKIKNIYNRNNIAVCKIRANMNLADHYIEQ